MLCGATPDGGPDLVCETCAGRGRLPGLGRCHLLPDPIGPGSHGRSEDRARHGSRHADVENEIARPSLRLPGRGGCEEEVLSADGPPRPPGLCLQKAAARGLWLRARARAQAAGHTLSTWEASMREGDQRQILTRGPREQAADFRPLPPSPPGQHVHEHQHNPRGPALRDY
jgi:hypothetical protein